MLVLLVILPAWLLLACVVIAACRAAAPGDAVMEQAVEQIRRRATLAGVVLWEQDEASAEDLRGAVRIPSRSAPARESSLVSP